MITAKKSLGQNFLTDRSVLKTIITTANLTPKDIVLEIGPGEGFLTTALLETGVRVLAVEKDDRLIGVLNKKFAEAIKKNQLELIHNDILNFDFYSRITKLQASNYKLVANIPYYLTGQIIRHFLTVENQPTSMTLMLQKEVAKRIIDPEKESLLSISVKCYGTPHYIRTVPRGAFQPVPGVDSAILQIDNINRERFREISEKEFFALLHLGFDQKRKILRSKLGLALAVFKSCDINSNIRAEDLKLNHWFCLARQNKNK